MFLAFAAALTGTVYNAFQNWRLSRLYPVPGKLYQVNGYPMHLYCLGKGEPTVVLESGLGNDWLVWQKVQSKLGRTNRVCSYDRAGLGWSPPRPGSRGALAIARQLEQLLRAAGVNGPLLLVGHSAGGLYARAFAGLFPHRVAGLVLADASSPEAFASSSPEPRKALIAERHRESPWLFLKVATGLARLTGDYCNPNTMKRIPAVDGLARAEDCRPFFMNSWLREWDEFEPGAKEVAKLSCCGSIPLVVLSRDPDPAGVGPRAGDGNPTWDEIQERLKKLSSRGARIIALRSGHYIMVDRPELILEAVQAVEDQIGGNPTFLRPGETVSR